MRKTNVITIMLTGQADNSAINRVQKEAIIYPCIYKLWTENDLFQTLATALDR